MNQIEFSLNGQPYIELSNLLKITNLVNSGGEAKIMISEGMVFLNGEVELRKRKKIFATNLVTYRNTTIKVIL